MSKSDEFYNKLQLQLGSTNTWPDFYLYKFIIKSESDNLKLIKVIFKDLNPQINIKSSKNNKYSSISIKVFMKSPLDIIDIYKEVGEKIPEVISL
jgi:putative lipoic acid-binding regulatory protein